MGYSIRIRRPDGMSIAEDDWRAVVDSDPTLSYSDGWSSMNPRTGEMITIGAGPSDADWNGGCAFRYFEGSITFGVPREPDAQHVAIGLYIDEPPRSSPKGSPFDQFDHSVIDDVASPNVTWVDRPDVVAAEGGGQECALSTTVTPGDHILCLDLLDPFGNVVQGTNRDNYPDGTGPNGSRTDTAFDAP